MRARWLALLLVLLPAWAAAHVASTGLATLDARSDTLAWRITLSPAELGDAGTDLARAAAGDTAAAQRWGASFQSLVAAQVDGQPCRLKRLRLQASGAGDERVQVLLDQACAAAPGQLQLDLRLTQAFGEHHRDIVSLTLAEGQRVEQVFDKDHTRARFDHAAAAPQDLWGFVRMGGQHILSGWDHLLFLAALLMGARGLRSLLVTATAFTLAHSATLALAVLGLVHASAAWVEPAIAASIVWVALENLWRPTAAAPWRRHALAFGFGLVHGLAFAEALTELQLRGWPLGRALLGFNLGVEAGQALVILALAPLLAWLVRHPRLQRLEKAASLAIAAMGGVWLVQRLM